MVLEMKKILEIFTALLFVFTLSSCGEKYTPEQEAYIKKIEHQRELKNLEMMNDPNSPFNGRTKIKFHPLKYFDVDPSFVFYSKLYEYSPKDTITIWGTKGEARKSVRYGYLKIRYKNKNYKLNVYKNIAKNGQIYFSIWFTDKTTGKETYGVGRYLDFEKSDDPNHIYKIDFNLAFNPYCAYSPDYTCAIPSKEDYLDFEVRAGEKKFHD